jgi:peptide/nickel transport system substrate-binding protein
MRKLLAALLLLPSLASAQPLRIGLASDPDILDPTLSRTSAGRVVFSGLCDKLVEIDAKLNFVPQLATAWAWQDEGKTLALTLRPGVKFHDGGTMDAASVQASLQRHLTMQGSTRRAEMGPITAIDATGPLEVKIRLSAPFAPLVAALSDRAGMMMSPSSAAQNGENFAKAPGCAGPFKFTRRIAQDRIELERFAEYWDAKSIAFDSAVYRPIPDATVRAANLRSGTLDVIEAVNPNDVPDLKADRRVKVHFGPSLAVNYLAINVANGKRAEAPLGSSKLVRAALEAAIDRKVLNQVAFEGLFTPGNQAVPPGHAFYADAIPVPPRDLAKAKALLKQAGFDTVKMQLTVPNTTTYRQVSEVLQAMAAEAGIQMELVITEVATSLKQWTDGDFESLVIAWSGRTDIDGNLYNFKACGAALNGGRYCNADVDRLLNLGRQASDPATRKRAYAESAAIYLEDRPYIYLWHPVLITGTAANIEGLAMVPDGLIRPQGLKRTP